jgi:hypothetical protein
MEVAVTTRDQRQYYLNKVREGGKASNSLADNHKQRSKATGT